MSAIRLMYRAETGEDAPDGPATCWFCAGPCAEDGPEPTDIVRSTFSDMARARAGGDGPMCPACVWYLDFKILRPGGKRGMGLYTKTVVVEAGPGRPQWREWEREEMVDELLTVEERGLLYPTYFTCNYSKQKHVLPWARCSEAGERYPWISTDEGETRAVRLTPQWPALAWCIAYLWDRGYPKTLITSGELGAYQLSQSDDFAGDLAVASVLRSRGPSPLLNYLSYIVTEDNRGRLRDTLAGRAGPLLGRHDPSPKDRGAACGDPQRGGRPGVQEPVPAAVVGDRRGAGEAGRDDVRQPDRVEQLGFL